MIRRTSCQIAPALLAMLALAGCSGEPTGGDIEKAVKASAEATNQQLKQIGGDLLPASAQTQVHEVKKIGCAKAEGEAGFNCDVEVDMTAPLMGRSKQMQKLRFVKADDGWRIAR